MATVKSFVKKNRDLYISNQSSFDGMQDCVTQCEDKSFRKVTLCLVPCLHRLDIQTAWFVGGGRDYVNTYEKDGFKGYEISNCCGRFILAVKVQEIDLVDDFNYVGSPSHY